MKTYTITLTEGEREQVLQALNSHQGRLQEAYDNASSKRIRDKIAKKERETVSVWLKTKTATQNTPTPNPNH